MKQRRILKCDRCGVSFERKISEVSDGANYCSRPCYVAGQRGKPHNWRSGEPPVLAVCVQCEKPFTRYASQVRLRGVAKFCSVRCRTEHKSHRPKLIPCKQCGTSFDVRLTSLRDPRRGKFCSRVCSLAWRRGRGSKRVVLTCAQCGDSFDRPAAWVRKARGTHYCSTTCASTARRRGLRLPARGVVWDRLAASIRERDEFLCVRCGQPEPSVKSLNVDHIVPARLLLDSPEVANDPRNLASLCTACHAIKTHRYEPRILRGDWLAIEEFYDAETRQRVTLLVVESGALLTVES